MGFEDFPKTKPENKKETSERESEEKVLNPEEIEQLGGEMSEYVEGLRARIEEIKTQLLRGKIKVEEVPKLEAELEELQTEYDGLKEMADDIKSGNFEEITEKPYKSEKE